MLSTFTVTNLHDDTNLGSLRWAIGRVNSDTTGGVDTIDFNIPGTGPFTIAPASALPVITHPVVINGYSQPGASANTLTQGDNAKILIDLDGTAASSSGPVDGLAISAGDSTVEGLAITGFQFTSNGIHLTTLGGDLIEGDFIGTNTTGTAADANTTGLFIDGVAGVTVGGTSPAARDILSANEISLMADNGASGVVVQGDYIGTDITGTMRLGAFASGIDFRQVTASTIGGTTPGSANLISGNNGAGVSIDTPQAGGIVIQGNLIGTDVTGTLALGNNEGVFITDASNVQVGGVTAASRNIISGNGFAGINVSDSDATFNVIQGNYIGVDISGSKPLGNSGVGIDLNGATLTQVGGTTPGAGNVISANGTQGIVDGTPNAPPNVPVASNLIQGNFVGVDATGTIALGNGASGMVIDSANDTIGGTSAAARNIVSANGQDGLDLAAADATVVEGNLIGTDATGTMPFGNTQDGVFISGDGNTIGPNNTIAFNGGNGVTIGNSPSDPSHGDQVTFNSIFSNGMLGIDLGNDGVTLNNPGNLRPGPNGFQNFPVLTTAASFGGNSAVTGTLNSRPNTTYLVQLFGNTTPNPSGFGEGEVLLASFNITTDASGNATFNQFVFHQVPAYVSATATDPVGDTSEFAADIPVVASAQPIYAGNDTYTVDENTTLTMPAPGVQANDVDLGSTTGQFRSIEVAGPSHGTVALNPDGSFTYTPTAGFVGTDSFTYVDNDGTTTSNVATVTLIVQPKTFVVTNTNDSGPGSLRQAILEADNASTAAPDIITFDIAGTGPFTIAPLTPLPAITQATIINGYTQPGATPNKQAQGDNAVLLIDLDGTNTSGADGLYITAGGSTVEGLAITRFTNGIHLIGQGSDLVSGDFIGNDTTGSDPGLGNSNAGVDVDGVSQNTIGGTTPAARDVFTENGDGVLLTNGATRNLIAGDYIGTEITGTQTFGNNVGVALMNATANTIGGMDKGSGNLISANSYAGVQMGDVFGNNGATGTLIVGNLIGTDLTGTKPLGNSTGVLIFVGSSNVIGGTTPAARNVISGNGAGVNLSGSANVLEGNYIGTDITGTAAVGNSQGVTGAGANQTVGSTNTIGGTASGAGNLISGNAGDGIDYSGNPGASQVAVIQGNLIGTDKTGKIALPNGGNGINLLGSSIHVGGSTRAAANVISGNGRNGILAGFDGNGADDIIQGNLIGTDITGTKPLGNGGDGIQFQYGATLETVGGLSPGVGNTIAYNAGNGVNVLQSAYGDTILSNSIYSNAELGIDLGGDGVTPNHQGGPIAGDPNGFEDDPVLTTAATFGGYIGIAGTLNSAPDTSYTIQFFANPAPDPSGFGQGRTLLGTTTVTTDASGNVLFKVSFKLPGSAGTIISSTATDPNGNTSEFSADLAAVASSQALYSAPDSYNVDTNTTLTVPAPGVLANDVAITGSSAFTAVLVTNPSHGVVTLNSNGSFTYTPTPGYTGPDSFTYRDVAGSQKSNIATVTFSVNPKTFVVTNTNDSGPGSLRQAILGADLASSAPPDTILFDIPGTGPFTIAPLTALPAVTHATIINGYTQPGASANALAQGDNAVILIALNGSNVSGDDGLLLAAAGSTIEGLAIGGFNNGIHVTAPGGDTIEGDFIGTDATGSVAAGNSSDGVFIDAAAGNTIGGASPAARDLISGNGTGIDVGNGASANLIVGDFIGTDHTGTAALGNGTGVALGAPFTNQLDSPNNTVGGTAGGDGNLISGNSGIGVQILDSGTANDVIQGNLIGTDVTGTLALGNQSAGIAISSASGNLIGGSTAGARNVISANGGGGVAIGGFGNRPVNNVIQGNFIGTDLTGTLALGNNGNGISLNFSAGATTIGGTTPGAGNVISGSVGGYGIEDMESAALCTIQGNDIGTDVTGTRAIGNGLGGIEVTSFGVSPQVVIGGTQPGAGNVISGNGRDGVDVIGNVSGSLIEGNQIGTSSGVGSPLGNARLGIWILDSSSNNTVGGTAAGAGNTIACNADGGVFVGAYATDDSIGNAILSNSIYGNGGLGIDLGADGVTPNDAGGLIPGPNGFENDPVLTSAVSSGGTTTINGTLNAANSTTLTIQFFLSATADPSGYGQGQTYLGSIAVTTDASGNATFAATIPVTVPAGQFISATATDPGGNTSEFAQDIAVTSEATATGSTAATAMGSTAAMATGLPTRIATIAPPAALANSQAQAPAASSIGTLDDEILTDLALNIHGAGPRKTRR